MSSVLCAQGLCFGYAPGAPVLEGLELLVAPGEVVAILGPSGCGKSTLMRLIMGLLRPGAGQLKVRARVAMVFQRPQLLPWRSALDNASYGLECAGAQRRRARAQAGALLERMGLGEHLEAPPHQLSEGMKQRVNLARALLIEPGLLLLDEPFSALDLITRRALQRELLALHKERGCAMLLVSHALDDVVELAGRAVVLSARPARALAEATLADGDAGARYRMVEALVRGLQVNQWL